MPNSMWANYTIHVIFFSFCKIRDYLPNVENGFNVAIFSSMRKVKTFYFTLFYFLWYSRKWRQNFFS